jgi:hypothetical protein
MKVSLVFHHYLQLLLACGNCEYYIEESLSLLVSKYSCRGVESGYRNSNIWYLWLQYLNKYPIPIWFIFLQYLLDKKEERYGRNPSGDSSGCSSGHESVSSSLKSGTQFSSDSGTEVDQVRYASMLSYL